MPRKFIPDGDAAFADMARAFVQVIARKPDTYNIDPKTLEHATRLVQRYRDALAVHLRPSTSTECSRVAKDQARAAAEAEVRSIGRAIRGDDWLTDADRIDVGMPVRKHSRPGAELDVTCKRKRASTRSVPSAPPYLRYVGPSKDPRKHVLSCKSEFESQRRKKPEGAVRVELFVEFLRPGEQLRRAPATISCGIPGNGRLWYLRSFTTSRIEIEFPLPAEPMVIVYWARWANQTGEVGPWSQPAVARIEFATPGVHGLPGMAPPEARGLLCSDALAQQCQGEAEIAADMPYFVPPKELPAAAMQELKHDARYMLTARELRECYVERGRD